jgi:hypothetical protein
MDCSSSHRIAKTAKWVSQALWRECRLVAVMSLDHDVFVHVPDLVTAEAFSASTPYECSAPD